MKSPFFARHWFKIMLFVAFVVPFSFVGAFHAARSNKNDVSEWLPTSFIETEELSWFRDHFFNQTFLIISWDGCRIGTRAEENPDPNKKPVPHEKDDPRIELLARKLINLEEINTVLTGPQVLTILTGEGDHDFAKKKNDKEKSITDQPLDDPIPYEVALDRLRGSMIGPDGRQTCVIVTLSQKGKDNLRPFLGRGTKGPLGFGAPRGSIFDVLDECDISAEIAHLGGPSIDNVTIDEEGEKTLFRLAGLSGLIGLVLAYWLFRNIRLTLVVFACGVFSTATAMSIVYFTGERMDAILMSMPAVIYVLGISGAIHIINYYQDEVKEHGTLGAPDRAVAHGWLPCALAASTTAMGLASLCMSNLVPIQKFGFYSAIGVMATLAILFTYLPAVLHIWISPSLKKMGLAKDKVDPNKKQINQEKDLPAWVTRCFSFVIQRNGLCTAASVAVAVAIGWGLWHTTTSIQIIKLFDSESRIIADYQWLEDNLCNLVPMEVVINYKNEALAEEGFETVDIKKPRFDEQGQYRPAFVDRMFLATLLQEKIEELPEVDRAMSASTFTPNVPVPEAWDSLPRTTLDLSIRNLLNQGLTKNRKLILKNDYVSMDDDKNEMWRISARVKSLGNVDYAKFVTEIREKVQPVLAVYDLRDTIARKIYETSQKKKKLAGSKVCVMGVTKIVTITEDGKERKELVFDEDAALLVHLLYRAGCRVSIYDSNFASSTDKQVRKHWERRNPPPYFIPVLYPNRLQEDNQQDLDAVVILQQQNNPPTLLSNVQQINSLNFIESFKDNDNTLQAQIATAHSNGDTRKFFQQRMEAVYTGVVPLVFKTQRELLKGLFNSVMLAFVLIAIVMMVQLRSLVAGLISMLPNLFPIMLVFGVMGWAGIAVDIGTMMAASVGLGVAVDDTIHFLTWFRRGMDSGLDRKEATMLAYQRCARPMTQTTIIGGLGLSVFAISTFTPTQRFGYLMLSLLALAIVGDLILLPALLAGPVGKFFRQSKKKSSSENKTTGLEDSVREAAMAEAVDSQISGPHEQSSKQSTPHSRASQKTRTDGPHRRS